MKPQLSFLIITFLNFSSFATVIEIDPGKVNDSFFYQTYNTPGVLEGTQLHGQTFGLDYVFSNKKIAVAKNAEIDLIIYQDNELGYWPDKYFRIYGYLTNTDGTPVTEPVYFENTSTNPAQLWPGVGYYLPDGREYLPAATGYTYYFEGTEITGSHNQFSFSGIHFDLTAPDIVPTQIIGLRLTMSNYREYDEVNDRWLNPIHISSEDDLPHAVPEPSVMLFIGFGVMVMVGLRKRIFAD